MVRTLEIGDGITAIDTGMFGRENVTSAYLLEAGEPALVETGSTRTVAAVAQGLEELGVGADELAHVLVTHVHLDHAGGVGRVSRLFPRATVWVHERGAPHLVDPTRLVSSAARVFGEDRMAEMFGPVEPVDPDRVRPLADGDRVDLATRSLEVISTPGHASHHIALLDTASGGILVGDALGVFLPDIRVLRPATAPPEFDLERAVADIRGIAAREPSRLLFSHFGPANEVEHLCHLAIRRLERWTSLVDEAMRGSDELGAIVEALREGTRAEINPAGEDGRRAIEDRYELLSSYEMNAMGIMRYLRRMREKAETPPTGSG